MNKKLSFIFFTILFIILVLFKNVLGSNKLPLNPKINTGKLDNGLTYYVMENTRPENRAELLLLVNVGSILEEDHQQGVAHFTEHMAFNGTKHYPENEVIKVLEEAGMKFGVDINAFTDFENTVYILNLPNL